jgi:hypothetical protein
MSAQEYQESTNIELADRVKRLDGSDMESSDSPRTTKQKVVDGDSSVIYGNNYVINIHEGSDGNFSFLNGKLLSAKAVVKND